MIPPRISLWVHAFPVATETFVLNEARALAALGWEVRVEVRRRGGAAEIPVDVMAEETTGRRLCDLAWLAARHPGRCLADLAARRRWRRQEHVVPLRALAPAARRAAIRRGEHLRAHFAAGPALDALRVAALLGRNWSVQVHGYDVYLTPANLPEKLSSATFACAPCAYAADHLRALGGPGAHVEEIVMGVDPERFHRTSPPASGRRVLGIGRLVPKKGWDVLIRAAAQLGPERLERVTIIGEGPERARLEALCAELGVWELVALPGAASPEAIRAELERTAVFAAPCVIAADGDRDTMPVVVKEALAMEVPVVASDAVGLPEAVRPGWGRLVAPGDPNALAGALEELLELGPEEREEMGRAGRGWVEEHAHLAREAEKLAALISRRGDAARGPARRPGG